jgi:hypothetical protein
MRCAAGRVWSGMPRLQPGGGGSARMGASAHVWCGGSYRRGVVLAACRQPNRRCGRGGAGALTAAESDGSPSARYVRPGLVLRPLLVLACAALRVACGAVCRGCDRVKADRLGWGRVRTYGAGGEYRRVWCSRPAESQIGDAGVEALARALPPSLTTLGLSSACGGLVLRPLLVLACAGLRVARGAVCRACNRVAADRLGWGRVRTYGAGGQYWRVWCSRPAANRIGDAGLEALARALPPSLTELYLSGMCGLGLYCGRCWS